MERTKPTPVVEVIATDEAVKKLREQSGHTQELEVSGYVVADVVAAERKRRDYQELASAGLSEDEIFDLDQRAGF